MPLTTPFASTLDRSARVFFLDVEVFLVLEPEFLRFVGQELGGDHLADVDLLVEDHGSAALDGFPASGQHDFDDVVVVIIVIVVVAIIVIVIVAIIVIVIVIVAIVIIVMILIIYVVDIVAIASTIEIVATTIVASTIDIVAAR